MERKGLPKTIVATEEYVGGTQNAITGYAPKKNRANIRHIFNEKDSFRGQTALRILEGYAPAFSECEK